MPPDAPAGGSVPAPPLPQPQQPAALRSPAPPRLHRCCHNRIRTVLVHTSRYAFEGPAKLAADCGVSRSTICRLLAGKNNPSYRLVQAVTDALAKALGTPLNPRDLFSPNGTYPEPSGCALCGCSGCLPEEAFDPRGRIKPEYRRMRPGDWSRSPTTAEA